MTLMAGGSQQPLAFSTCWLTRSFNLLTGDFIPELHSQAGLPTKHSKARRNAADFRVVSFV
jgi:hypothetical protein